MKTYKLFTRIFFSLLIIMLLLIITAQALMLVLAPNMVSEGDTIATAVIVENYPDETETDSVAEEIHYIAPENISDYVALVIKRALPYSLLLSVVVSLLFSFLLSRRLSGPIVRMAKATEAMAQLLPDAGCHERYCAEISLLSDNINNMYAALRDNISSLKKEKNKVIEAEKMKLDFLRAASHELKTPVTSANIILENMILKIGKYSDYSAYLPKCKGIVENLGEMINEILLTSQMGFSDDNIKTEAFELSSAVFNRVEEHKIIAERRSIAIELDLKRAELQTDRSLFNKVLSNIIGNAVRYANENGRVKITLEKKRLTVFNECMPLADEELRHIFEPFYRPDYARSKESGGSGLGLYTSGLILKKLGYSYRFTPEPENRGMNFIIDFYETAE